MHSIHRVADLETQQMASSADKTGSSKAGAASSLQTSAGSESLTAAGSGTGSFFFNSGHGSNSGSGSGNDSESMKPSSAREAYHSSDLQQSMDYKEYLYQLNSMGYSRPSADEDHLTYQNTLLNRTLTRNNSNISSYPNEQLAYSSGGGGGSSLSSSGGSKKQSNAGKWNWYSQFW